MKDERSSMEVGTPTSNKPMLSVNQPGRMYYALLILVFVAATWLRFDSITTVGIRYQDEAWYVSDAQLWHRCAKVLIDVPAWKALLNRDKAGYQQRMADIGVDFSGRYRKPSQGFTLPAAAIMFLVGEGPAALLLMNAFFGTMAVLILYSLCRILLSPAVALIASALLAVSPYHLIYTRSAFAHTTAGCAALLSIYLWALGRSRLWSRRKTFLLSGLACGYAATCHYSIAYFAGIPLFMELFTFREREDIPTSVNQSVINHCLKATAWMCLGFAIPFFAIESIFISARIAATVSNSYLPMHTFFQGIAYHVELLIRGGTVGDQFIHTDVAWSMIKYFTHWHGPVALGLALVGMVLLLGKRTASSIAAWLVLASIFMLLIQSHPIARGLNGTLPFLAICTAVAANRAMLLLRSNLKLAYASVTILICVILTPAIRQSVTLHSKSSDLALACQFLSDVEPAKIAVPNYRRYWIHLEKSEHELIDTQVWVRTQTVEKTVQSWLDDGVRWVAIDPQYWHSGPGIPDMDWWLGLDQLLRQRFVKAAEYSHLCNYRWEFLAEGSWGPFRLYDMNQLGGGAIRIYDLQHAVPPSSNQQG